MAQENISSHCFCFGHLFEQNKTSHKKNSCIEALASPHVPQADSVFVFYFPGPKWLKQRCFGLLFLLSIGFFMFFLWSTKVKTPLKKLFGVVLGRSFSGGVGPGFMISVFEGLTFTHF